MPTIIMQNKANFREGQMSVISYHTKGYENLGVCRLGKNKAKQSQFVFMTAENAEYAEKNDICVSDCQIEKYALYPISLCFLRARRLIKTKPIEAKADVKMGKFFWNQRAKSFMSSLLCQSMSSTKSSAIKILICLGIAYNWVSVSLNYEA